MLVQHLTGPVPPTDPCISAPHRTLRRGQLSTSCPTNAPSSASAGAWRDTRPQCSQTDDRDEATSRLQSANTPEQFSEHGVRCTVVPSQRDCTIVSRMEPKLGIISNSSQWTRLDDVDHRLYLATLIPVRHSQGPPFPGSAIPTVHLTLTITNPNPNP